MSEGSNDRWVEAQRIAAATFGFEPGRLQWAWRQNERTDRRELECAIIDALGMGGIYAHPGDGVSCAAQIVMAQMDRAEAAEKDLTAALTELTNLRTTLSELPRIRRETIEECARIADGFVAEQEARSQADTDRSISLHTLRLSAWDTAKKIAAAIRALADAPAGDGESAAARDVLAERKRRETIEECARWHDERARDTPDAFEMELHRVSAAAIRALVDGPADTNPQRETEGGIDPAREAQIRREFIAWAEKEWPTSNPPDAAGIGWRGRAIADAPAGDGWHDISTIPDALKDGRFVLLWIIHPDARLFADPVQEGYSAPAVAYWTSHNHGGWVWHGVLGAVVAYREITSPALLPPPPAEKG